MTAHPKFALPVPNRGDGPADATGKVVKLLGNPNGVDIINNTTAYTGKWFKVVPLATASFTSLAGSDVDLSGTFPVAMTVGGPGVVGTITNIKLASGTVAAYRMDNTATA